MGSPPSLPTSPNESTSALPALDAATAGHRVGYYSPSQFSREYARTFGAPPLRDVARLKAGDLLSAG